MKTLPIVALIVNVIAAPASHAFNSPLWDFYMSQQQGQAYNPPPSYYDPPPQTYEQQPSPFHTYQFPSGTLYCQTIGFRTNCHY